MCEPVGRGRPGDEVAVRGGDRAPDRGRHPAGGAGGRRGPHQRARHPAGRGPHPHQGLPRRRQDRPRPGAGPLDRLPVRARAVHRRPASGRHRRHERLQPARGSLRVPARPDLRERGPRGRGQPRVAQDPVRHARVHAGAPRDGGRPHARAGAPLPRLRHAEPRRVRGDLPAARGPGGPFHGPPHLGYPADESGMLAGHESVDRVLELEAVADHAEVLAAQEPSAASTPPSRCATTSSRSSVAPATTTRRARRLAARRADALRAAKARALLEGRDHALPDDVQALAPGALPPDHARARGGRGPARRVVADAVASTPAL